MLTDLFARAAAIVTRRQVGDLAPVDKAGYVPSLNLQARVAGLRRAHHLVPALRS
jgi:hypothetical protein